MENNRQRKVIFTTAIHMLNDILWSRGITDKKYLLFNIEQYFTIWSRDLDHTEKKS